MPSPNSNHIEVRPLVVADAAQCAALRREMLADAPWAFASSAESDLGVDDHKVATRLADPAHASIGAFNTDQKLLGVAGLMREPKPKMAHRARIWGVYVTPAARGLGIARLIVTRALDEARLWHGVNSVGLSCSERALAAKKTYESLGFKEWGREPAAMIVDGTPYDEHHLVVLL